MFKRVYIEITNVCNLNCSFCPQSNRDKKFMSVEDFKIIINKIKDYTNNIYLHVKGEPLLHPDLKELLEIAKSNNLEVNITTNGRLLKEKIDLINCSKIRQINISLHSFNDINDMIEIIDLCDSIKDTNVSLRLWNDLDNNDILKYMENKYNIIINRDNNRITLSDNVFLSLDKEFAWPDMKLPIISKYGSCLALKQQIAILVDGKVVTCCLDNNGDNDLGNIYNEDLIDIINSKKFKDIRDGFKNNKLICPLCQRCGYVHK